MRASFVSIFAMVSLTLLSPHAAAHGGDHGTYIQAAVSTLWFDQDVKLQYYSFYEHGQHGTLHTRETMLRAGLVCDTGAHGQLTFSVSTVTTPTVEHPYGRTWLKRSGFFGGLSYDYGIWRCLRCGFRIERGLQIIQAGGGWSDGTRHLGFADERTELAAMYTPYVAYDLSLGKGPSSAILRLGVDAVLMDRDPRVNGYSVLITRPGAEPSYDHINYERPAATLGISVGVAL